MVPWHSIPGHPRCEWLIGLVGLRDSFLGMLWKRNGPLIWGWRSVWGKKGGIEVKLHLSSLHWTWRNKLLFSERGNFHSGFLGSRRHVFFVPWMTSTDKSAFLNFMPTKQHNRCQLIKTKTCFVQILSKRKEQRMIVSSSLFGTTAFHEAIRVEKRLSQRGYILWFSWTWKTTNWKTPAFHVEELLSVDSGLRPN